MPNYSTNLKNMEKKREIDKLARWIMIIMAVAAVAAVCWFFRNVLIYIIAAVVVSLIGSPIIKLLRKIKIKNRRIPSWINAVIALLVIMSLLLLIVTQILPVVGNVLQEISISNIEEAGMSILTPLDRFNGWLTEVFPSLGNDFRIEIAIIDKIQKMFDISAVSTAIGTVAGSLVGFITDLGIGIFSVVFISFFFLRDSNLFSKIICAIVPDKHEKPALEAIDNIGHLLSRYFGGLIIEMTGVAVINFIGLMFIAKLGFNASIGIAFITGLLNIIPYVGPLMGGVIGTILGTTLKICTPLGMDVHLGIFILVLIAIFCFTQLIDNIVFQPLIYSSSIKANPLEIFIVLLLAGTIGGMVGMLVAIPSYTVIRVIAGTFFRDIKAIRKLIPPDSIDLD